MEGTAATLLILVAVMFVNLLDNCAEGLQCRKGDATNNLNKSTDTSTFGACADPDSKFCFAAICKFTDSYAIIGWNCSLVAGEEECAADAKNMAENCYNKKIVSCECHFGKKGKDWSNALFDVPPSIQTNLGFCPISTFYTVLMVTIGIAISFHANIVDYRFTAA